MPGMNGAVKIMQETFKPSPHAEVGVQCKKKEIREQPIIRPVLNKGMKKYLLMGKERTRGLSVFANDGLWMHRSASFRHNVRHGHTGCIASMYDAYDLARHAADLWQQIVDLPSICGMVRKPEMLAYHIASKIPVQDATRQELLEIDGVVSRLQREIRLLEAMNLWKCRCCMALIVARRIDILVMSAEGPMDAFVNNYGIVHETVTLLRTQGLMLIGVPETQHSWFPGYSWTMAFCSVCQSHMGWLYKAVKKGLYPRFFWGVRRSQLAESTTQNE